MRIRAAVLEEFGQPLVVQELDLAEPKAGEVLVRLGACGVCHTDLYTASGADPSGYAPCVLGHEGAGVVERVGDGVTSLAVRRPRRDAVRSRVRRVHPLPQRADEPLRTAIRDQQGLGYLPDGTTRLSRGGEPMRHYMGTSTFAEYTVMPEIALAKVSRRRRSRAARRSRAVSRPESAPRSTRRRSRRGRPASCSAVAWSDSARSSAADSQARNASSRSTSPRSASHRPGITEPPTCAWRGRRRRLGPLRDRRLRCGLHVRGDRQRARDAPGSGGRTGGVGARDDDRCRGKGGDPGHRPPTARSPAGE